MRRNSVLPIITLCLTFLFAPAWAQEVDMSVQPIMENEETKMHETESVYDKISCGIHTVGIYVSPYGTFYKNDIANQFSLGGRLSLIFNNRFHWGIYASKSAGKLKATQSEGLFVHTNEYGGNLEFTLWNRNWIHIGIPVQSGFQLYRIDSSGGKFFNFDEGERNRRDDDDDDDRSNALAKSNSFDEVIGVIEPGINLEINVFRCVKLFSAVNYRLLFGKDIHYQNKLAGISTIKVSDMSSLGLQIGAKIGFFEPKRHCCSILH